MNTKSIAACILAAVLMAVSCGQQKGEGTTKEVDTIVPRNDRYNDDTTINSVNRMSGHDRDTVTIFKKDSARH